MDRLILIRHGETEWNAKKVLQGQADIELNETGMAQAKALRALLKDWQPDTVICSDLKRTRQTAECLARTPQAFDPMWRETHLGSWTGRSVEDILRTEAADYQAWRDGQAAPPGGESFEQLRKRVAQGLRALHAHRGTVWVITHGGILRAALSELVGIEPSQITPVQPASATVFDLQGKPRLHAFNLYANRIHTATSE